MNALQQILHNYGDAVGQMPHDVAAYYLCHRCASDATTVRNMRETMIPALRKSPMFDTWHVEKAVAMFEARFPAVAA